MTPTQTRFNLALLRQRFQSTPFGTRKWASKASRPPATLPYAQSSKPKKLLLPDLRSGQVGRSSLADWKLPKFWDNVERFFGGTGVRNFKMIVNLLIVCHLITTYVFVIRPCFGPSMLPTISWEGDYVLISKLHRYGRAIDVGDLVSYSHPIRQGYKAIKRVVGMPGDFVVRDTPGEGEHWMLQVPEGHCWVVGDNMAASRDSRHFGPLPLALIRGKVVARVWPKPKWIQNGLGVYEELELD